MKLSILLALAGTEVANGLITDLICASPGDWKPDAEFYITVGQTNDCKNVVTQFIEPLGLVDNTAVTAEECAMKIEGVPGKSHMTVSIGMAYLTMRCCGGATAYPCGFPIDQSMMPCATDADFESNHIPKGVSENTCMEMFLDMDEQKDKYPTCSSSDPSDPYGMTKASIFALTQYACCAKPGNICGDYNVNLCADPDSFKPEEHVPGFKMTCQENLALVMSITSVTDFCDLGSIDDAGCKAVPIVPGVGRGPSVAILMMDLAKKCCRDESYYACSLTGCPTTTTTQPPVSLESSHAKHTVSAFALVAAAVATTLGF